MDRWRFESSRGRIKYIMNIDLKSYNGFAIVNSDSSSEALRLILYCGIHNIPILKLNKNEICPNRYVPCGGVEWVEVILNTKPIPDYYPKWATSILYRNIWKEDTWILGRKLFVKPADRYKRFTGFITYGTYAKKKKPPLIWSEIVSFDNEWRYYISNGKVLASGWYWGRHPDMENPPEPPDLDFIIPRDYSGALDLGIYNNKLTLVESQHPYACGWYGDHEEDHLYFQWLIDGWEYMNKGV